MHNIINLILETKKRQINILRKNEKPLYSLLKKTKPPLSFKNAIKREGKISLIAEIKQASISSGILKKEFNFLEIARIFKESNVSAISVLTEEEFFLGKLSYIENIKKEIDLPILRKDFIIDEIQILESKVAGADAILLIANILDESKLKKLYVFCKELNLDAIVEIHTQKDLKKALNIGAEIIGINNRNLNTLKVDLSTTEKLIPFIPKDAVKVSESGINSMKDVLLLKGLGVDAVLVGEALMKAENIKEKINELNIDPL